MSVTVREALRDARVPAGDTYDSERRGFSPAMRLLLACARWNPTPAEVERIGRLSRELEDWQGFLQLVDRHRVAPLVFSALSAAGSDSIPEPVREELRRRVEANTPIALMQAGELRRLAGLLAQESVASLPLKGPALSIQAYGDPALRGAGDLDVLVAPAAVADAERVLTAAGYVRRQPAFELTPRQRALFVKSRKHFLFSRNGLLLELHWGWANNPRLFPVSIDSAQERARPLQIGDCAVAALPRTDLLLYLCAHGSNHAWFRLKWLCDVRELLVDGARIGEIDLGEAVDRARDLGVDRMLGQGLILAHRFLDAPVPPDLLSRIARDRKVCGLVATAEQAIAGDQELWMSRGSLAAVLLQTRYRLKLRGDVRYKLCSLRTAWVGTEDWQELRLPDWLFPIYVLLRPVLSALRRLRAYDTHSTNQRA